MCPAQGPQRSDASEAWTRDPLVSSQALYHWATALPQKDLKDFLNFSEHHSEMIAYDDQEITTIIH